MESIVGFVIFLAVALGAGYFVYTRIMAKKAKVKQPPSRPVDPTKGT